MGCETETFWQNLLKGKSGIAPVTLFDTSDIPCRIGAEVKDFDATPYFANHRDAKRADRYIGFSVAASKMAIDQSGLDFSKEDPGRTGVFLGTGIGGLHTVKKYQDSFAEGGYGKVSPFLIPMMIGNAAGGIVAMDHGISGPNFCVSSACASGSHSIGEAWKTIKFGDADMMIAGGSESVVIHMAYVGFCKMRALSSRNDEPQRASRPFDRDRDGFVMGEGAGVVVLEEYEHAKRRGADILCALTGYGTSADAYHPAIPHPEGRGASQCMERALARAGLRPDRIDYINAHGTSTQQGDLAETQAIKHTFGDHARNGLAISSTKSMTGHLLGAAGGVELAACVLALRDGVVPPTINLENPDPECDLCYVPNEARELNCRAILSNSFGFGGNNASLVVERL